MDFDSDQMMIVDNDIMIDAAVKNYDKFLVPTTDIEPDPKEEEYTAKNLAKLDYESSENLIGQIVNLSQVLNSKLWHEMNKEEPNQSYVDRLYKDVCQLSIMSGLEIDKAKKTLIVDNKNELKEIRERYKSEEDGKIGYPMFFKELGKKGNYDSKKTYIFYNTTLDMIGREIAYKTTPTLPPPVYNGRKNGTLKYIKSFYGAATRTKFNLGRTDCNKKGLKDGY